MSMFEGEEAYRQVEKANIFLYELNKMIKWESFRETIEKSYKKSEYAGGRPAYDKILMFKISNYFVFQCIYYCICFNIINP